MPSTPRFRNVYADEERARSYADLEYPRTYGLAFRDLPDLIRKHATGTRALDFGCGTGRSSRFLKGLGFQVTGVDIAEGMVRRARERDPGGDYRVIPVGDLASLEMERFDLILSAFTFDNVPDRTVRERIFASLAGRLTSQGRMVNLVSAAEIYVNEWASFSTRAFPQNATARSGELVRIVMLDVDDRRPVEDVFWTDADYRDLYAKAGLSLLETHRPLGRDDEGVEWVTETRVSPWAIYVLGAAEAES